MYFPFQRFGAGDQSVKLQKMLFRREQVQLLPFGKHINSIKSDLDARWGRISFMRWHDGLVVLRDGSKEAVPVFPSPCSSSYQFRALFGSRHTDLDFLPWLYR